MILLQFIYTKDNTIFFNAEQTPSITLYTLLYVNPHLSPSIVTQTTTTRKLSVPNNRINFTPKQEHAEQEEEQQQK